MTRGSLERPVGVGLLGCGNVGAALVQLLADDSGIEARSGMRLRLAGVAVADTARQRQGVPPELLTGDADALVASDDVEVVVELIGGLDPARRLVEAALRVGKPVVTANKELLGTHGASLASLADDAGVDLLYEAAVAGAIPLVRVLRESLAGEQVRRVTGIVNGTTNFILTMMSDRKMDYADVLAEAQHLGLAERDPTADVEGHDAAAKAAIIASLAFRCDIGAPQVPREGISAIRPLDIAFAEQLGYVVKLLAVAERVDHLDRREPGRANGTGDPFDASGPPVPEVSVRVHPAMLPRSHPLAAVRGAFNAVFVEGESCGEMMLYGRGAGGKPTASAVLGDLLDAAHHLRAGTSATLVPRASVRLRPAADLRCAWYIAIDVADRPGVLAAVATVFGDHGVSIRSMEQVGLGDEARLIFVTHVAREGDVRTTLEALGSLDVVENIGGVLRVAGDDEEAS